MTGPKILTLDIETMPAVAEVFSLHGDYIPIQRVREAGYVFGFGYKWHGKPRVGWVERDMVPERAQALLTEADIVVTYNGDKFDLPNLSKEMAKAGLAPPAPYRSVDLYRATRRHFKFESNKLDFVAGQLGLGKKLDTDYSLWRACMEGDRTAWAKMARYCRQDVKLTEKLHDMLLPWIGNYPNVNLWIDGDGPACTKCGSRDVYKNGTRATITVVYQRYQCKGCGSWFRGTEIVSRASGETRAA